MILVVGGRAYAQCGIHELPALSAEFMVLQHWCKDMKIYFGSKPICETNRIDFLLFSRNLSCSRNSFIALGAHLRVIRPKHCHGILARRTEPVSPQDAAALLPNGDYNETIGEEPTAACNPFQPESLPMFHLINYSKQGERKKKGLYLDFELKTLFES